MKIRVQIDGYINVDDVVTEEQVRETVLFQLGWGGMDADNRRNFDMGNMATY